MLKLIDEFGGAVQTPIPCAPVIVPNRILDPIFAPRAGMSKAAYKERTEAYALNTGPVHPTRPKPARKPRKPKNIAAAAPNVAPAAGTGVSLNPPPVQ